MDMEVQQGGQGTLDDSPFPEIWDVESVDYT